MRAPLATNLAENGQGNDEPTPKGEETKAPNESILTDNCKDDSGRKKIVLNALGKEEYVQLKGRTSPRTPESMENKELLRTLKEIFGPTKSLRRRRHETLPHFKYENEYAKATKR
ncbi:unnamed protein product [Bursaphelenchus xylophilus]|uniref:(pine wood nematode) hypothetical protein n=1 Tax=Bursaphelenchus xylophilus TaxID=6326 RepID=A0A1I7S1G5_BURXY|nr:unnamed protein product [Bursaphelenchus xylophilus]CAG9081545.1 unnamed protein product [Bursaphelenchus xylophilus]